jgi:hypothetical protein
MKVYFLEQEQLDQILAMAAKLQRGSDKERDPGHSLWRLGTSVRDHQEFDPAKPVTGASGT